MNALEANLLRYVVRYGEHLLFNDETKKAGQPDLTVTQFVCQELKADDIALENALLRTMLAEAEKRVTEPGFRAERFFLNHPDARISMAAASMISDPYELSKMHSKYKPVTNESSRLDELLPRVLLELKNGVLVSIIHDTEGKLKAAAQTGDNAGVAELSAHLMALQEVQKDLAKNLGDRIVLRH